MNIGQRIHTLREQRNMTLGDVEHASGLLRCYISRVEHGHTVPSVGTLEKFADARWAFHSTASFAPEWIDLECRISLGIGRLKDWLKKAAREDERHAFC